MVSFGAIWALVLRHTFLWRRDINFLLAAVYWPMLDILVWGFLGRWIQGSGGSSFANYESVALLGILMWQVIGRGANIIAFCFNEELWSHNIVNLFSLPLRTVEWMIGIVLFYGLATIFTVSVCMILMFALYDVSLWYMTSTFLLFLPPLFLCGIWLGFTCLQIVVLRGKRGIELGFIMAWFLLPFSGAYYPIEVLPWWGRALSSCIPMSYIFSGMRSYLMHQQNPTVSLLKGYVMSTLYAFGASLLFLYLFQRSKQKGLSRLAD
jgi:ABC-2 type transport system permease protein